MLKRVDPRQLVNWQYGVCPLDAAADRFGPFRRFVGLWRSKRRGDALLPTREDFDFFDFRGWWGKVAIAQFERDPFDVRFVLWGTDLVAWWGVDYTNKLLGEQSITPEVWREVESRYFQEMVRDPFIGIVTGTLDQHERPFIRVIGIDLPLADGDGRVGKVLSAHLMVGQDDRIETHFPDPPIERYF